MTGTDPLSQPNLANERLAILKPSASNKLKGNMSGIGGLSSMYSGGPNLGINQSGLSKSLEGHKAINIHGNLVGEPNMKYAE
mmetsp:Transcript_16056/g.24924  ORF Transcript_16056/g.24924 Transcript_16056/m.24924 type:complete len:82 (-) Transcript_16056:2988-3233(-)